MTGKERSSRFETTQPPWELADFQKDVAKKEFNNLLESQVALINAFEKLNADAKEEIWTLIDLKLKKHKATEPDQPDPIAVGL